MADKPSQPDQNPRPGRRHWLDKPSSFWLLITALILSCALALGLDFVIHRHVEFEGHWLAWLVLLFAALAFVFLFKTELYPAGIPSLNIESDWLYRRLAPRLIHQTARFGRAAGAELRQMASNRARIW